MSFTVATVNVNGIRAASKIRSEENQGIIPWIQSTHAEIILMQEVRATQAQTEQALEPILNQGWYLAQAEATAKGRAGVAILSRFPLENVQIGFGDNEFQDSGRYIQATVSVGDETLTVASIYLPSGTENTEKQDEKYRFQELFAPYMAQQAQEQNLMLVGGDWNICHRRQDLKNWKPNRKKAGFLPAERAFLDHIIGTWPDEQTQIGDELDAGRTGNPAGKPEEFFGAVDYQGLSPAVAQEPAWFDVVRRLHPEEEGPYSWWSYRGKAFDTDAGWRIDLQLCTSALAQRAQRAWVDRAESYDQRWSDHAPVVVEFE